MNRRGFTLIEVLVTMAIIGVLVAITSYVFNSSLVRSRDGERKTNLDSVKNALEQYYLDNRAYPAFYAASGNGLIYDAKWQLEASVTPGCSVARKTLAPFYLPTIPEDPKYTLPQNVANCADLTGSSLSGHYLYFVGGNTDPAKNDPAPKKGYYLLGRMEAARDVNYQSSDGTAIEAWGYSTGGLSFCADVSTSCSQNYVVKFEPNK